MEKTTKTSGKASRKSSLRKSVKPALTKLSYKNPKTGNMVGYSRAHSLGLIVPAVKVEDPNDPEHLVRLASIRDANEVKKQFLYYENPKTHNLIGYLRALQLHLTTDPTVKSGLINPKTGHLVGMRKAKQMGLIKPEMLKHAA